MISNYPLLPGYKEASTSKEAAESMASRAGRLKVMVLAALTRSPMTPDECADTLGESVLSIRPRFSELNRIGKIRDIGERRINASGKKAKVWSIA